MTLFSSLPPIAFDLIILLIVLVSALLGRKRGFVLTLCGSLALFVALFGAAVLTDLMAPGIGALVLPIVEEYLSDLLAATSDLYADAGGAIHATLDQILPMLRQIIEENY